MRLHRFHGGLRLPGHKAESTVRPLADGGLPARLAVPLAQHAGEPALACVAVGQRVRRGERIGQAQGERGAHVHAPAGGTVAAIEPRDVVVAGALRVAACVVIDVDATDDESTTLPPLDLATCDADALIRRVHDAGIVGLGGATFPTAVKLAHARRLLILNGAECEPWIACDEALLRARADDVVRGGLLLQRATGAQRVVLAIEDRMADALRAAADAIAAQGAAIELVAVPTIYPAGGERQLIEVVTGEQVSRGGLPRDIGVLVQNVGTAAACWRAASQGEPLLSRIVTVTGPGVAAPGNFEVVLGTPVAHLVALAGGYTEQAARLLAGGPMMGVALPHDDIPVGKGTNCVLVLGPGDVRETASTLPCIRCGDCAAVCPAQLLPQQLHLFLRAGDEPRALEHGLLDCIECGACDLACPSHLPLVQQFRDAKADVRQRAHERRFADVSRERYLARNARLARDAEARALALAAKAPSAADAMKAALERAKARKRGEE